MARALNLRCSSRLFIFTSPLSQKATVGEARADWEKDFSKKYSLTLSVNGRLLSGVDNVEYKDYYDISAGTVTVSYPAYTLWKLSVSQLLLGKIRLTLALDNVFNYKPKYYYLNCPLTDGINFQAGLSFDIP